MLVRRSLLLGFSMASAVLGLVLSRDSWAQDVRHLCSEKYQAAKAAGTLNGDSWPQFYSKCTAEAKANPPAAEAAPAAAAPVDIRHICSEKYQAAKAAGTLNGEAWPQFYSRCTTETKANPPAPRRLRLRHWPAAPVAAAPPPPAPRPPLLPSPRRRSGSRRRGAATPGSDSGSRRSGAASGQSAQKTRAEADGACRGGGAEHRRLSHRHCTGLCQ